MQRFTLDAFRGMASVLVAAACTLAAPAGSWAQQLVVTTGTDLGGFRQLAPVVVFPDMAGAPVDPPRNYVTTITSDPQISTHGLALVAADRALASQINTPFINVIDTSTATRTETFTLPDPALNVHYDGLGTFAVNPARTYVLVVSGLDTLWVIAAPFDHTAAVTMLALPSSASTAQTRAIAFDSATGRAYVALQSGIVVLDAPYTSIAYTIASSNGVGATEGAITGAIALSPDNATLVATRGLNSLGYGTDLRIFHAPFSAASVADVLSVAGASLDGLTFTPDSSKLLVVESKPQVAPALPRVYAVASPYSSASTVEMLTFDPGTLDGFEDVDISADGQLAALSGGSGGNNDPLVLLKAPFTAAGFTFTPYAIPGFATPFDQPGRGDGTARFWTTAVPVPAPQVWIDPSVALQPADSGGLKVVEGDSGTTDAIIPVDLSGPSTQTVTVDFTTVDGTAKAADDDYLPASGTLTFAPGETHKNIVVKVVGDTKYELDETFSVVISNPVNATILGNSPGFADTGTVFIVNDDTVIPFAILTTALPDGATGVPYSFQLTGQGLAPLTWSAFDLPVGLAVDPVTGIISGIPIFAQVVDANIKLTEGGGFFTGSKFLSLTVTGTAIASAALSPNPLSFGSRAVGSTSGVVATEIENGGGAGLVLGSPIFSVPPGSEFALATGFDACTPGQTIAPTFGCNVYFTFTPQGTGTRTLTLPLITNAPAVSLTLTGVGTSGASPVVSIAGAASVVEGNSGTASMTFPVTLSAASASAVTVHYAATGGNATGGVDYTVAGTGTLTFAAGVTTQHITVNVIGDTTVEADETVVMTLSGPVGATLGTATATGIILNDDAVTAAVLAIVSGAPIFGDQVLATTGAPVTVRIGNTGGSALVLAAPFAVIPASDFASAAGPGACVAGQTLAPAATCNLHVTFTPSTLGIRTADVVLASNAPDVTLALTAVGVTAREAPPAAEEIPTLSIGMLVLLAAALGAFGACIRRHGART